MKKPKSILLRTLSGIPAKADRIAAKAKGTPVTEAVGFFDFSGSTKIKSTRGHEGGIEAILRFVATASIIVKECAGSVIKELGDGILCTFLDPLDACRGALNLKLACHESGLVGRFGLTIGRISRYTRSDGSVDVLGTAVDRCARVQSFCFPGQILMDEALFQVVKTHLEEFPDVLPGKNFQADAKGLGLLDMYEVSLQRLGLTNRIATPFLVHADGRRSIAEKVQLISQAESDVIEIGIGLTSFAKYFTGQKPNEWRNHIRQLIRNGVEVRCYAVDPTYHPAQGYLADNSDEKYEEELRRARDTLLKERKQLLSQGYTGQLRYFVYRRVPSFHCLCVDGADAMNARMLLSPYMPGLPRAECPVYQVSRIANPDLFEKYWQSIQEIHRQSSEVVK